jgi:phosphate transport system permease protein
VATAPEELPRLAPREEAPKLEETRRWVKRADRLARGVIVGGGIAVILAVLLILILIGAQSVPIWRGATGAPESALRFATEAKDPVLIAFSDPYRVTFVVLRASGVFQQVDRRTARVVRETPVPGVNGSRVTAVGRTGARDLMAVGFEDGRAVILSARVRVEFGAAGRVATFDSRALGEAQMLPAGTPVRQVAAAREEWGMLLVASSGAANLVLARLPDESESEELPGAEPRAPSIEDLSGRLGGASVTGVAIADTGQEAVAATTAGSFLPMSIDADGAVAAADAIVVDPADPKAITATAFLLGGQSIVFGDEKGRVSSWFRVRAPENPNLRIWRRIHVFEPMPAAVTAIGISASNKCFVTADARGDIWLRHNTSDQTLLRFPGRGTPAVTAGISGAGDGLHELTRDGLLLTWAIKNPHPETTLKTLFGKVWYEGYDRPEYSWQSTGATDDFEPKFSLTPLIFGTLKATFYALLFAIPVALGAALYAAVFAHPSVRRLVKPVVEIMAALPSVVIGFLAGLWLAPLIERLTVGTLLLLPVVPVVIVAAALGFQALPRAARTRFGRLREMLLLIAVVVVAAWLAYELGPWFERTAFGGDFKSWLFQNWHLRYDPRNSIVIGFAMGFAVIPIIFTISEDAFSNVPAHLSAASLALGASRWQTATRVVVPTASPGVFSAVMIGFGRAVGETMIVLMATGNTPIMEWSIFNGMRTLSANIAVEIPEAPFGGTLYRVLFFAAAILFVMTFLVNTLAEIVRQRLRRKYEAI